MGPNSSRTFTYVLVLGAVGALITAVYNTNKQRSKAAKSPAMETTAGVSSNISTDTSFVGTSPAALTGAAHSVGAGLSSVAGAAANGVTGAAASTVAGAAELANYSTKAVKKAVAASPEIISTEDPSLVSSDKNSVSSDPITASAKAVKVTSKAVHAKKHGVKKHKFDPGAEKGDFMVIAGNFASKDNADALLAKLKKLGFAKAEVVKLDNSATLHVVAGNYSYKGGADAALRTLKSKKIQAFVKKKSGSVYKVSNPTPAAPAASKPS